MVVTGLVVSAVFLAGLGLYLGGGLPRIGTSNGPSAGATFAIARTAGDGIEENTANGGWSLVAAYGFDSSQSGGASVNTSWAFGWGCTASTSDSSAVPSVLSAPGNPGLRPWGAAPWWGLVYYRNSSISSSGDLLLIQVVRGAASAVGIFSGGCTVPYAGLSPIPTLVVDSGPAVSRAQDLGGAGLLSHDSNASISMELSGAPRGELSGGTPLWQIGYNNCGLLSYGGWQEGGLSQFAATLDGATGTVLNVANSTEACNPSASPPSFSVTTSLTLGIPTLLEAPPSGTTLANQGCDARDYCYQVPLNATSAIVNQIGYLSFTPQDFQLEVLTTAQTPLTSVVGYEISGLADDCGVNCVGQSPRFVRAWSFGALEGVWSGAAGGYIDWGISTLWIDMGPTDPTGSGYALHVAGVEQLLGEAQLSLP
ncbi:MAG: hypothetical protein WB778_05640 [Thermoplasmata archaeon]